MKDAIVGTVYTDSGEPIHIGDRVLVDLLPGRVTGIFLPGTDEAFGCCCEDTGALAILFDDGTSVLFPFGCRQTVTKAEG
jgi:hypothetical protein